MANPTVAGTLNDKTTANCLAESAQHGRMPSYPTFNKFLLILGRETKEAGPAPGEYASRELREGRLRFAVEDPGATENMLRTLTNRCINLLGSSAKGTGFFLCHLTGANNDVNAVGLEGGRRPASMTWRESVDGKLNFMRMADFHNTLTILHPDVVLSAAT